MDDDGFGVAIFWMLAGAGMLVWWGWNDDGWIGRMRYAWSYDVPSGKVMFSPKPYDCDWLSAPLGAKHCTYEPAVSAYDIVGNVVWRDGKPTSAGDLIYKNGKLVVSHGDVTTVQVGWTRVPD